MQAQARFLEGLTFETSFRDHRILLDTSSLGGTDKGPSPKEMLLGSIMVCSGMDVVSLLKKWKIPFQSFEMEAKSDLTETYPKVFKEIHLLFRFKGESLPVEKLHESIELSMTKYCGVSAMVSKVSPILYSLEINEQIVRSGQARFWDH